MADVQIKRALIAVYDKTGIADFARTLVEEFRVEIISTGGTARHLSEAGIPVTLVEDVTGFPEMLDGRVKTLHPRIYAAILADRDNPEHMGQLAEQGIEPIDMVVVNLYPFAETIAQPDCGFEDALEMIDIGGPGLLRAAAKNHKHVLVVSRAHEYEVVLARLRDWGDESAREDTLRSGAFRAFWNTTAYDAHVATWLSLNENDGLPDVRVLRLWNWGRLRYGENPHQHAELLALYGAADKFDLISAETRCGDQKRFSFNNYVDVSAALELCAELTRELPRPNEPRTSVRGSLPTTIQTPVCVLIKHTNACGVGAAVDPIEAYRRAYLGDPNAAMGGVLACNFNVTPDFATAVMETYDRWGKDAGTGAFFVEVWVAPSFDDDAVNIIRTRKKWGERARLLDVGDMTAPPNPDVLDLKKITGGVLMQHCDLLGLNEEQWEVVTNRQPTAQEMTDLRLAWLVCKHTKSNAVTICKDGMLIGNGAGQMSRVMSCRIATWLAAENGHLQKDRGVQRRGDERKQNRDREGADHDARPRDPTPVAASDGFFPFRDGPDILMDAGVTAIIQPGGSKRDTDTIAACDERGAAMIFTHTRHFKH